MSYFFDEAFKTLNLFSLLVLFISAIWWAVALGTKRSFRLPLIVMGVSAGLLVFGLAVLLLSSGPSSGTTAVRDSSQHQADARSPALETGTVVPLATPTAAPPPTPKATPPPATATAPETCPQDPKCRLSVSSDQLLALYEKTSNWTLEEQQHGNGERVFTALSHDNHISLLWVERDGIVFVEMLASIPNVFDQWAAPSVDAELRSLVSAVIPQPWQYDYTSGIMSIWYGLESNPASRQNPSSSVVNGVGIRTYYSSEVPAVGVIFWTCGQRSLAEGCQWQTPNADPQSQAHRQVK